MSIQNGKLEIKCYTMPELAKLYKVSPGTFKNWLVPFKAAIGERRGYYYSILQVKIILEKLGTPGEQIDLNS